MLKQFILLVIFLSTVTLSYSQKKIKESAVPEAVKKAFKKKYPRATEPIWRKPAENEYDVEYELGPNVYYTKFSADGKWMETSVDVSIAVLPKPVKDQWKKNEHKDWEVLYVVKLETADTTTKPKVYYQIAVKKDKEMKSVLIAADGKFSSTEVIEDDK